jgi:prolyl 4-hydroxylase
MNEMFSRIHQNEENVGMLSGDPWVLEFHNFLSDEMIDELLSQVTEWERSYESGEIDINGAGSNLATQTRTSSTFWCNNDCQLTSVSQHITDKIQSLLQIPKIHYEPIQLLKYNVNESYITHHDFSYQELTLPCGPRVLTFFLYLSDVEEGGATHFPDLNLTISPQRGKAVLWPNTLSVDPRAKDTRMSHEAQRVTSGVKYAANVWIHLQEWDRPSLWACTGS